MKRDVVLALLPIAAGAFTAILLTRGARRHGKAS